MLKALLRGKLGRLVDTLDDGDITSSGSRSQSVSSWEDPLTSAAFERLAYLEPRDAWSLLAAVYEGDDRIHISEEAPTEAPVWSFWPRLSPGPDGSNVRHVEPDVVIAWGSHVLVVEAKHLAPQNSAQWVEQIRALRADRRFADKYVVFIAAGGLDACTFAEEVANARRTLGDDRTLYLLLRWAKLGEICKARQRGAGPGVVAVLRDVVSACAAWGYRSRVEFESLPEVAATFRITATPKSLAQWSVK